jgi:diacylglycerol kinase (ATP)
MFESFAFVVNPQAGRGKARGVADRLVSSLRGSTKIRFTVEQTKSRFEGAVIGRRLAQEFDVVVAVGGDGTVHEVAHGVFGTKSALGVLPIGSGNDFARLLGTATDFDAALRGILGGRKKRFDVGTIETDSLPGVGQQSKIFINSLGIGLDAAIAYESQKISGFRGITLYLLATLKTLRTFKAQEFTILCDGQMFSNRYFLVCVGNGDREGGGFRVTPNAQPDDGKFEVCLVQDMPMREALRAIPLVLQGTHGIHPRVKLMEGRNIEVRSQDPFIVHADGEIVGTDVRRIRVKLGAGQLNVVCAV